MRNFHATPLVFAVFALAAQAEPRPAAVRSVDQLKLAYLDCERHASAAMLDFAHAASCSAVHEELKQRGFGGNWSQMFAWWQAQRLAAPQRNPSNSSLAPVSAMPM